MNGIYFVLRRNKSIFRDVYYYNMAIMCTIVILVDYNSPYGQINVYYIHIWKKLRDHSDIFVSLISHFMSVR